MAGRVAEPGLPWRQRHRRPVDDHRPRVASASFPGTRLQDATLELKVRASRGGPRVLTVARGRGGAGAEGQGGRPADPARREHAHPDHRSGGAAGEGGVAPDGGLGIVYRAPAVSVGGPAVTPMVSVRPARGPLAPLRRAGPPGVRRCCSGARCCSSSSFRSCSRAARSPRSSVGVGAPGWPAPDSRSPGRRSWRDGSSWSGLAARPRLARAALHDAFQIALVLWTLFAIVFLYAAAQQGLALRPDMQVAGGGSSDTGAAVVPGPRRRRAAAALRAEPSPLGLSPGHAGLVALARAAARSAGCPGAGAASRAAGSGFPCGSPKVRKAEGAPAADGSASSGASLQADALDREGPEAAQSDQVLRGARPMCRNIRTLFNFDPPATDEEIRASAAVRPQAERLQQALEGQRGRVRPGDGRGGRRSPGGSWTRSTPLPRRGIARRWRRPRARATRSDSARGSRSTDQPTSVKGRFQGWSRD